MTAVIATALPLERYLPRHRTTFFAFGRQALAGALRRSGVGAGDEVLVPGFVCRELLASLHAVGAVARFYAVDETLSVEPASLPAAMNGRVRAVIAVDYFGFPQRLEPLRTWAAVPGAALIEDNAHGFLSDAADAPLGHRGDFGVMSLRKTIAVPNGAALIDNRRQLAAPMAVVHRASPRSAEWRYRVKMVIRPVLRATGVPGTRAILGATRLVRAAAGRPGGSNTEAETAMPDAACSRLTAGILSGLDVDAERARRRSLYCRYQQLFSGAADVRPVFAELPAGVVPYGFPFRYLGRDAEQMIATWWRRGVSVLRWPELPSAMAVAAPAHYRNVMVVPFLW